MTMRRIVTVVLIGLLVIGFALAQSNRHVDAYVMNYRGRAYASTGAYAKAIADYTRALELNPDNTAACTLLDELQ